MKPAAEVLTDLAQSTNIAVHSSRALCGEVDTATAQDDKKRDEKELEPLRRKPTLQGVPAEQIKGFRRAPWQVLHSLGRAISLARRGAGRGLAEHWGSLKYSQALSGRSGAYMGLSAEGRETADYYKALQSGELGTGLALALATEILQRQYPDHCVSIIPADTVLRAGFALTSRDAGHRSGYRYRPRFFAEVWKPGQPSRVVPIESKGNHSNAAASHAQLASASAHVEAVHIGAWNETASLLFSTELPLDGALTVYCLQAPGKDGWLRDPSDPGHRSFDHPVEEANIYPGILAPSTSDDAASSVPGFHLQPEHHAWFGHVLARTLAAGLTAFAGDGDATAQYLTKRQGQRHFTGFAHAATGSVQDARQEILGTTFVGTDHVFRLNRTRVEAFSGVAEDLFGHLEAGHVQRYRNEVYARRGAWPEATWDSRWGGPVSVTADGSVLAIRQLREDRH
ncbi:hypothetical protein [Streptomyces sp. NPDC055056]